MINRQYEKLLSEVLTTGTPKEDRTGTGTWSVFGRQLRYDLSQGFPLITTKKIHFKSIAHELLWFLRGDSNTKYLEENGVSIWSEWQDKDGELGPVYGVQWRAWPAPDGETHDQITEVLHQIRNTPDSRRMLVSAWNVDSLPDMALMPCHVLFQFYVAEGKLSCQLYQRSADMFLGVPFNIASYSLLTHMFAQQAGLEVGEFIWTGGDVHVYRNHQDAALTQLARLPKHLPALELGKASSLFDYKFENMKIVGYDPYPAIKASVAV